MELNPYQERAVSTAGHGTILACPDSGKTRVFSARAERLLANHPKGRLCAVTFTRAAAELRTRNYRCAPNILGHAAKLIAHNRNRAPKKITAHREEAGEIRVVRAPDRWAEAEQIAAVIGQGAQEETCCENWERPLPGCPARFPSASSSWDAPTPITESPPRGS